MLGSKKPSQAEANYLAGKEAGVGVVELADCGKGIKTRCPGARPSILSSLPLQSKRYLTIHKRSLML